MSVDIDEYTVKCIRMYVNFIERIHKFPSQSIAVCRCCAQASTATRFVFEGTNCITM